MQAVYEYDSGSPCEAEKVDALAPYEPIADGFYRWACVSCAAEHSDRWHIISGRVVTCECGKANLLVRTDCAEINSLRREKYQNEERDAHNVEMKKIINQAYLGFAAIRRQYPEDATWWTAEQRAAIAELDRLVAVTRGYAV